MRCTNLVLHETLHGFHKQHGLTRGREGDYRRYRRYCTRQLRRVRKILGSLHSSPRVSLEHILIQLLAAERAWAHAAEIKMRTLQKSTKLVTGAADAEQTAIDNGSQRRLRQRLLKASMCSETLRLLCATMDDELLKQECSAYADWLKGLYFELRGDYVLAADTLERARMTYVAISKNQNVIDWQIIFQERATTCSSVTRRCRFKSSGIKLPELDDGKLIQSGTESSDPTTAATGTFIINWCGCNIEIITAKVQERLQACKLGEVNPKYIVDMQSGGTAGLCAEFRVFTRCRSSPDEAQYAHKLLHLDDILRMARAEDTSSPEDEVASRNCISGRDNQSLEPLAARVSYEKLALLYQRCDAAVLARAHAWRCAALDVAAALVSHILQLCMKTRLSDDIFYLYQKLMEITSEMCALIDTQHPQGEALAEALGGRAAMLSAYKCHFLGETFGVHIERRAFCLFNHAVYLSDRALQEAEACEALNLSQEMAHLSNASRAAMSRLKAARFLEQEQSRVAHSHFLPALINCLDIHIGSVLAQCANLSITPAATKQHDGAFGKPVLFNLAHAHLKLPSFRTRPIDDCRRGLFGWFR